MPNRSFVVARIDTRNSSRYWRDPRVSGVSPPWAVALAVIHVQHAPEAIVMLVEESGFAWHEMLAPHRTPTPRPSALPWRQPALRRQPESGGTGAQVSLTNEDWKIDLLRAIGRANLCKVINHRGPELGRRARYQTWASITCSVVGLPANRMVVIELNDCREPRLSTETIDSAPLPEHGNRWQRFARREILSARNGLLRTNPYWRTFEATRWVVQSVRRRKRGAPGPDLQSPSAGSAIAMRQ